MSDPVPLHTPATQPEDADAALRPKSLAKFLARLQRVALGRLVGSAYRSVMGEMSFDFPPDLRRLIEARVEEGHYADPAEYVRDLVRRETAGDFGDGADRVREESPEEIAWVREQVAIGLASGLCEKNAFEVLDEIRAGRADRRG